MNSLLPSMNRTARLIKLTSNATILKRNNSTVPFIANYKNIPGLMLGKHFTTAEEQRYFEKEISDLFVLFRQFNANKDINPTATSIPQASKKHNLPSQAYFRYLEIPIPGEKDPLKVEYFEKYGEEGHELAYIRGRGKGQNNIPSFAWTIARQLSSLMSSVPTDIGNKYIQNKPEDMVWKLTLNYYTHSKGKRAGFPFHTDIAANGEETFIVGFGSHAKMQFIKHKEDEKVKESVHEVQVGPGEIVGLTGAVRNTWLHRVLPEENVKKDRISMVLGTSIPPKDNNNNNKNK